MVKVEFTKRMLYGGMNNINLRKTLKKIETSQDTNSNSILKMALNDSLTIDNNYKSIPRQLFDYANNNRNINFKNNNLLIKLKRRLR